METSSSVTESRQVSHARETTPLARDPDLWLRIAAVAVEVEGLKRELGSPAMRESRRRLAAAGVEKRLRRSA
jgi:hypothetical protein